MIRPPRRRVVAVLAVLGAVLALTALPAAAAEEETVAADRVVVVGVPGLAWTDLSPDGTPELWQLAGDGAIGSLSVRAARSLTCVLDGWATLGAGNRARYPGPEEPLVPVEGTDGEDVPAEPESLCDRQQLIGATGLSAAEGAVARTATDPGTRRFGARPGALGEQVGCAGVVGRPATLAVARPGVELDVRDALPEDDADLAGLLTGCPLSLLALDGLVGTASLAPDEPGAPVTDGTPSAARAAGLAEVDAAVGRVRASLDGLTGETLLVVAGISEVDDDRARLHAVLVEGPGFAPGSWLTSASTGRAPFVQLIDVAPTALQALGLDRPPSMNGQPVRPAGERPALGAAVELLEQANVAARVHYRSTGILFWTLVAGVAGVVLAGILLLGRAGQRRPGQRPRRGLRAAALAVAALPVSTYLAGLVPWERTGQPRLVLLAAVVASTLAVALLAGAGPWRRHRFGPPAVVLGVTAATLVLDGLTGSHLELDGLLGYDAIVAGRFTGFGNLTFGLLSVSVLLPTAAAAAAAGRRAGPRRARPAVVAVVAVAGLLTVAVVGAPGLGRDFGGVLAVLPGFVLLGMLLTRTRVTVARAAAVLAAAVVAVGAVAVLDWRRPPGERSHLGRFVEQLLTGEAATVVLRKAQANVEILLGSPLVWTLPSALLAAVWLLRPGGPLRGRTGPVLRAGLLAAGTSLLLGAAVNDSGVAVPATAAALLVPLLVWLAAGDPEEGDAPRTVPAGEPPRVTVVSRGSTVGNA